MVLPARLLSPAGRGASEHHPDELASGHCPALSRPKELSDLLESYAATGEAGMISLP